MLRAGIIDDPDGDTGSVGHGTIRTQGDPLSRPVDAPRGGPPGEVWTVPEAA